MMVAQTGLAHRKQTIDMHNIVKNAWLCSGGKQKIPLGYLWSSTSGTTSTIDDYVDQSRPIVQLGGRWFAYSRDCTWVSNDGNTFAKLSLNFARIVYGNSIYVGVASGAIYSSSDGLSWTLRKSSFAYAGLEFNSGVFIAADRAVGLFRSIDGIAWISVGASVIGGNWVFNTTRQLPFKAIYFKNVWYVQARVSGAPNDPLGTVGIFSSGDGVSWVLAYSFKPQYLNFGFYAAGDALVVRSKNTSGIKVASSTTNGFSWTEVATTITEIDSTTYGNGCLIAIGSDGVVYDSSDGSNLRVVQRSSYPFGGSVNLSVNTGAILRFLNGVFFLCNGSNLYINSSSNGRGDWYLADSFASSVLSIFYDDGRYFLMSASTCNTLTFSRLTSYDSTTGFPSITQAPVFTESNIYIGATGDNTAALGDRADGLGKCLVCCAIDTNANYSKPSPPYTVNFTYSEEKK
ncbi:hypothetical protein [Limnohabitans sp.]|uniref:hypothetical protein n=1 Tax=Limnohabitans sp. TaxID=1907725 RepID=UPI00286F4958|nr:hypothetical protein [Limnohabitans sp.]